VGFLFVIPSEAWESFSFKLLNNEITIIVSFSERYINNAHCKRRLNFLQSFRQDDLQYDDVLAYEPIRHL